MKKISAAQLLLALSLLAVGVILLLVNLNLISMEIKSIYHYVYPFIFCVLGILLLFQGFLYSRKSKSRIFWGLFITLFSSLLIADRFEYITFGFWDVFKLWPFLFIFFALSLIFGRKVKMVVNYNSGKPTKKFKNLEDFDIGEIIFNQENQNVDDYEFSRENFEEENDFHFDLDDLMDDVEEQIHDEKVQSIIKEHIQSKLNPDYLQNLVLSKLSAERVSTKDSQTERNDENNNSHSQTNVNVLGLKIGDVEFKRDNWLLEPMKLSNTVANYFLDVTKAFIPEGETPVELIGRMGNVEILLPEDLPVKISVENSIGDVTIFDESSDNVGSGKTFYYESDGYETATKKLSLNIKLSIGSVQIDRV